MSNRSEETCTMTSEADNKPYGYDRSSQLPMVAPSIEAGYGAMPLLTCASI
jgi:hypothetical protein